MLTGDAYAQARRDAESVGCQAYLVKPCLPMDVAASRRAAAPASRNIPRMNATRALGSSGLQITPVGFGAWAAGGGGWSFGWGPQDDDASLSAMRRALEHGVNWIDTAPVYGLGHSEEIVGRLLVTIPRAERPLVFTKCGLIWDEKDRMLQSKRVLRPDSIRRECEASLRRLGVERVDLYQFHWPDQTGTPVEDSWAAMASLVDEGKVRAIGVCNFDVALLDRCEAARPSSSRRAWSATSPCGMRCGPSRSATACP